ncbi:MAG: hypothetical protein KGM47_04135, partial [Acidobacteriota bacterium]|nr:hypothetical protein [Acidobacteriota bacterium]
MAKGCGASFPFKGLLAAAGVAALMLFLPPGAFAGAAAATGSPGEIKRQAELDQLRKEIEQALSQIQTLQKAVNAKPSGAAAPPASTELQQQISDERTSIESLEKRLDQLTADAQPIATTGPSVKRSFESGRGAETTPGITSGLAPADIYQGGFFVETADKSFSVYMNGLFQTRFTWFKPGSSVA